MTEGYKPYEEDLPLLATLGLPEWRAPLREEHLIGEVSPFANSESEMQRVTVRCFVRCAPGQAWRFEVIRPAQSGSIDDLEQLEIRTGSGTLSQYWPMVLAVAQQMIVVGAPHRLR